MTASAQKDIGGSLLDLVSAAKHKSKVLVVRTVIKHKEYMHTIDICCHH